MADVFLSYARPDAAAAERVARALGKAGRSVWYDSELPAHRAYTDVIEQELESARAVLVLWSKAAVDSQWVRSEANRARELGKLVQARLEDVRLPMPFDQLQCADLSSWRRGGPQVERSIGAILDGEVARPKTQASNSLSRRGLVIGSATAGVAVAVGGGWWLLESRRTGPTLPPETAALMAQAKGALWQNTPEGQNQAIGIYRQIVAQYPDYSDAWGRLAMAYAWTAHWREASVGAAMRARAQSAAERALSFDARDVHALYGLAFAKPWFGNWLSIERDLRKTLGLSPEDSDVNLGLALVLWATGRVREPLQAMKAVLASGPAPGIYIFLTGMLWSAGRQDELDSTLDEAIRLYPTHFGLWFTRFYTEMLGGRPEAALAFAADTTNRPTNIDPEEIDSVVRVAKAIQSRSEPDVLAVTKEWMERAHRGAGYAENAAQFMAALGRSDEAFAVLRAYYFSEGFDCGEVRFARAIGSFTPRNDRQTAFLFNPPMANVRADQRFAVLVKELKLSDYWQASGRKPDYLT